MQPARLGCLSATGLLSAWVTLLVIGGIILANGGEMFSPGDLNAQAGSQPLGGVYSHGELRERCSACHPAFWERESMSDRCLMCHTALLQNEKDFHAVMLAQGKEVTCRRCHTDHRGAKASLTVMDVSNFPHDQTTRFSLRGHQKMADGSSFKCADCHGPELKRFELATCVTCHQQLEAAFISTHIVSFGQECLACHDGLDTYGQAFDHNQQLFPLLGKHAQVACEDCHPGARNISDLRDTPQDCYACHAQDDVHQGQFGQDCAACHQVNDWRQATFDHSLTAFPLDGAHARLTCEQCHPNRQFKGTSTACAACHAEPVYHQGLFGLECAACHSTEAWSPARFDERHTFPLNHGEAGVVDCKVCHVDSLQAYTCYGCHEHQPTKIAKKHQEEGIRNFQDCMHCHPTGRKEEGEEGGGDD